MSVFFDAANSALWHDAQNPDSFPTQRPLLAHYTSIATLEKIVQSGELWFSNPLYMNDWEELRFGMNTGASMFRAHAGLRSACDSPEAHASLVASFDELFNTFDRDHALDTYVLCLSKHGSGNDDGVLSMWRGYGANGSGVAIVFDSAKLSPDDNSPFIIRKVDYASQDERRKWIEERLDALSKLIVEHYKEPQDLRTAAHVWLERLKLFSLFTKHDGFSEENEWRIAYFSQRDGSRSLTPMHGYAISTKGVEPKLKLGISTISGSDSTPLSLDALVDRIILGPSVSTELAVVSIRRMLQLSGKAELAPRVVGSSIPFRA